MSGPPETGPLVCPVCGTPTVPQARFCYSCGAAVDVAAVSTDAGAERRVVTVLFGDLSDFTAWAEDLDPERVGGVTDRVLATLSKAVLDHGGTVDKLTGDGIMAVFGAPTAHEDDTERAVRAAAQMQREVRRLMAAEVGGGREMGLRVGLNTGEVLAGVQASLSYTVVGDTVNTASRLSDAARVGAVYAGRDTALATMAIASWRSLPTLRLKGKREPVAAYELVGLRPLGAARLGLGDEAPFIGREAEFGRLVGRLLDVVDRGRPASIVLTGEAGVGKTRLALEAARFAGELPAVRVLWGRCPPYGESRELSPLAEWMRTVVGITEDDDLATAEGKARRTLARLSTAPDRPVNAAAVDRLLALLGLVEWAPIGPRDAAAPGAQELPRDPVVEAVLSVLAAMASEGPLLLVVDDAQWATGDLFRALAYLGRGLSGPALFVVAGRSEVLASQWWDQMPDLELMPVAPLDEAASERLLRAYLSGADLDPPTRDLLLGRAQGNPFFLAEMLHLLVDRGLLRRVGDGWRLTGELPREMLPAGVQAVLAARIDGLEPLPRALLRDASVIGDRFTPPMLQALRVPADRGAEGEPFAGGASQGGGGSRSGATATGDNAAGRQAAGGAGRQSLSAGALGAADAEAVAVALDELTARGIVHRLGESSDAAPAYAFTHALARDVAYAGIPKGDRARRHATLALWAARAQPWPAIATDALVGGQSEQAVRLATEMGMPDDDLAWRARPAGYAALVRLGEAALARDDNVRADVLFTRALSLAGDVLDDDELAQARVGRAAARVSLAQLDGAETDLEIPRHSRDQRIRSGALVVLGDVLRRRGDVTAATNALVSALAAASESGHDRVTGEALRQLGMIDYLAGRLTAAEGRFGQSLALAERVGDRRGAGWALQHLAWSATTRGDYELAERTLAAAADVFGSLDDDGGLSWCAGTEAFVRLLQGRHTQARELAGGLLPLGRALGDRWGTAACLTIDGFAAAELGQISTAIEQAEIAYDEFVALADTWGQTMALIAWGVALRGAGRARKAVKRLDRAVEVANGQHPVPGALALGALGYCRLDLKDADGAAEAADRALATMSSVDVRPGALVGLRVLKAQALRAQGKLKEAVELLREGQQLREASLVFPRRQALAHLAGALRELGEVDEALTVAQEALAEPAEDIRSRIVALRALGSCLAEAGDEPAGRAALRQALALADATEMRSELPATQRALEKV